MLEVFEPRGLYLIRVSLLAIVFEACMANPTPQSVTQANATVRTCVPAYADNVSGVRGITWNIHGDTGGENLLPVDVVARRTTCNTIQVVAVNMTFWNLCQLTRVRCTEIRTNVFTLCITVDRHDAIFTSTHIPGRIGEDGERIRNCSMMTDNPFFSCSQEGDQMRICMRGEFVRTFVH